MQYETSIFEEKRRVDLNEIIEVSLLVFGFVSIVLLHIFGFRFIGWISIIGLIFWFYRFRIENFKQKGVSHFGDKKANLIISDSGLTIRGTFIPYSEMKNLIIYVDEYYGMPKHFIFRHHGGNNEIRFEHNNKWVSFNYIIKTQEDYRHMEKLAHLVETKFPQ